MNFSKNTDCRNIKSFLAHLTKMVINVSYCHHLASVVHPSVNFSHFDHLLWNHWSKLNKFWQEWCRSFTKIAHFVLICQKTWAPARCCFWWSIFKCLSKNIVTRDNSLFWSIFKFLLWSNKCKYFDNS